MIKKNAKYRSHFVVRKNNDKRYREKYCFIKPKLPREINKQTGETHNMMFSDKFNYISVRYYSFNHSHNFLDLKKKKKKIIIIIIICNMHKILSSMTQFFVQHMTRILAYYFD